LVSELQFCVNGSALYREKLGRIVCHFAENITDLPPN